MALFVQFVQSFGFFYTLFGYFLPCLLGSMIFAQSGYHVMAQLQGQMARGESPARALLRAGAHFVSGLFLIPSVTTRVLGLLLWVPFLRFFLVALLFKKLASSQQSHFRVYTSTSGVYGSEGFHDSSVRDVTPETEKQIEHRGVIRENSPEL